MVATFTIDWEPICSFKNYSEFNSDGVAEPTAYLLDLLRRHQIKAIFYCVGWLSDHCPDLVDLIKQDGHIIGDHTYFHSTDPIVKIVDDVPFRAPRWYGEKRLYSGGFWFRAMPYWWLKKEVDKTGVFFIHPHDVMLEHPDCINPVKTFERRFGLKTSRDKLERLCREVNWDEPG